MPPLLTSPRHCPHVFVLAFLCSCWFAFPAQAHHFKGLPHYNYFENYPQVPEEEFIGQAGDYEVSLVVYDFQGINRDKVETPDNVRLFLVIFNLSDNSVYGGSLTIEVLDGDKVVVSELQTAAELENLYSLYHELPKKGRYTLRLTLHDEGELVCTIPFRLSSQIIHWGPWVGVALGVILVVTAIGARRARVKLDRSETASKRRRSGGSTPLPSQPQVETLPPPT